MTLYPAYPHNKASKRTTCNKINNIQLLKRTTDTPQVVRIKHCKSLFLMEVVRMDGLNRG